MGCDYCHHGCTLSVGAVGFCGTKVQQPGGIEGLNRGLVLAKAIDPIEKKPLFHFFPGTSILSVGTFGCNLRCPWCQNWSLVGAYHQFQKEAVNLEAVNLEAVNLEALAAALVAEARSQNSLGIAFTYNEPLMWHETVLEVAKAFKLAGLKTVMVSNGCASHAVVETLLPWIDAWNIDLKAVSPEQYRSIGGSLDSVLSTIGMAVASGAHVELTTLIVPGFNDTPEALSHLVELVVSLKVPVLHLTRYYPTANYREPATPEATMRWAELITRKKLVDLSGEAATNIYLGNCSWADLDSYCKSCGHRIAQRSLKPISFDGAYCSSCGAKTPFVL